MNKDINKIIKTLKRVNLTRDEKAKLRAEFLERAGIKQSPIKSPFQFQWEIFAILKKREVQSVVTSFAFILMIGGSLSYAAENSLPGEMFYPIKKYLNEPTSSFIKHTFGNKDRTDIEIELLDKRLEEAEMVIEKEERKQYDQPIQETANTRRAKEEIINQTEEVDNAVSALSMMIEDATTSSSTKDIEDNNENEKEVEEAEDKIEKIIEKHLEVIDKLGL